MNEQGIIRELGDLPGDAVISQDGLAKILGKHPVSIKRAVARHELPEPVRLLGKRVWTVDSLRRHIADRLEKARQNTLRTERRISSLSA